jgi:hypothetical protein
MKVCSNSSVTFSAMRPSSTSFSPWSGEPPRSSSQLADQDTFVSFPVSSDCGRATGVCSWAGASVSVL